jgi:hypothetical protein
MMTSASTHCPKCHERAAASAKQLFCSTRGEYFTCLACHHVWLVLFDPDETVVDLCESSASTEQPTPRI